MSEAPSRHRPSRPRPTPSGKPGLAVRRLALEALLQTETGGFAGEWIAGHGQALSPADRGLCLEIALTSLRWRRLLDHSLEERLDRWPGPRIGWILRMALAQAWSLERIPVHAAVDLAVTLAREAEGPRMGGLVNAVLRRCLASGPLAPEGDDARALSIRHSHPEWLVRRWLERGGLEATVERLEAANRTPPAWVRVRPGAAGLPWQEGQILSTALGGRFLRLEAPRAALLASEAFARGDFSFQDPASGAAALALAGHVPAGGTFVDLCSAPGGKSAALWEAGELAGRRAFACDLSPERQRRTREGFLRLGIDGIQPLCADGLRPPFAPGSVDAVLLDAPCSNLGVLSRRPEARWRLRPDDLAGHAALQGSLLDAALELLRPGGVLVYSTCSVEPEETLDLVAPLLDQGRAQALPLPAALGPEGAVAEGPFLRVEPGSHGWDGFFVALLRKSP